MRSVLAVSVILVLVSSRSARAGGPGFELLCGTFHGDAVKDVLPSPKKPKIVDPIGCALRVTDAPAGWEDGVVVALSTTRYMADPATGKKVKQGSEGMPQTGKRSDDGLDYEWIVDPTDKDISGRTFYAACEDFDLHVIASTANEDVLFEKVLHVAQACPKPKPIDAKVTCTASWSGGSEKIPAHGVSRYGSETAIRCVVAPKAKRAKIGDLTVTGWILHTDDVNDTGAQVASEKRQAEVDPIDEGTWVQYDVDFQAGDWVECDDGTINLEARDASGNVVLSKKVTLRQSCPD